MYLEGLGFRAIGRLLKVGHTAVFYWIKAAGKQVAPPSESEAAEVAELDEMHKKKKKKKTSGGSGRQ
jgi:hypothetical protein